MENNRKIHIKDLGKMGIYSNELIEVLRNGEYHLLGNTNLITNAQRDQIEFMEPLLYAVKNDKGTYIVFQEYSDSKQEQDMKLLKDIAKEEPKIIEKTSVSNNPTIVLELVEENPEVVLYMSEKLKRDANFVEKLCEMNNKQVTMYVAKECDMPETIIKNPELCHNKDFMLEVVKEDCTLLECIDGEMKNDYEFMKEVAKDEKAVNYIVNNSNNFGKEGLMGVKDAVVEKASDEAISGFEEEKKRIEEQIQQQETAVGEKDELEELIKRNKQLERHADFLRRIKNGEVDAVRAAKLMDKLCVNLDDKYKEEIKKVLKLDEAILEKQKEEKANEQSNVSIKTENIEKATDEAASFEGIENETGAIRENMNTKENVSKIGEKDVNESNDERA